MNYLITDGSCHYKDEIGGWAALLITGAGKKKLLHGCIHGTTVSRCELVPLVTGMSYFYYRLFRKKAGLPLTIISDSEYTVKVISGDSQPSKNVDLWDAYFSIASKFQLKLYWRERNSHPYMKLVDAMAYTMREQGKKLAAEMAEVIKPALEVDEPLDM